MITYDSLTLILMFTISGDYTVLVGSGTTSFRDDTSKIADSNEWNVSFTPYDSL